MQIDIISDTTCPWCFIGKRRLERALAMRPQADLDIKWQPYQLNPTMPAEGIKRRQYLASKFGGAERAERQFDRIRKAGIEEGIDFKFDRIDRTPNTINSHRLVYYAGLMGDQDLIVERLFQAFFFDGRDVGDNTILTEIAAAAGLDGDDVAFYLEGDKDRAYVLDHDEKVRRAGITGVPCFILQGKYAISGAQSPEIFHQVFDLVRQELETLASGRLAAE